jgi:hypothetical protein
LKATVCTLTRQGTYTTSSEAEWRIFYHSPEDSPNLSLLIVLNEMTGTGLMPEASAVTDLLDSIKSRYGGYSWDGRTMVLNLRL